MTNFMRHIKNDFERTPQIVRTNWISKKHFVVKYFVTKQIWLVNKMQSQLIEWM